MTCCIRHDYVGELRATLAKYKIKEYSLIFTNCNNTHYRYSELVEQLVDFKVAEQKAYDALDIDDLCKIAEFKRNMLVTPDEIVMVGNFLDNGYGDTEKDVAVYNSITDIADAMGEFGTEVHAVYSNHEYHYMDDTAYRYVGYNRKNKIRFTGRLLSDLNTGVIEPYHVINLRIPTTSPSGGGESGYEETYATFDPNKYPLNEKPSPIEPEPEPTPPEPTEYVDVPILLSYGGFTNSWCEKVGIETDKLTPSEDALDKLDEYFNGVVLEDQGLDVVSTGFTGNCLVDESMIYNSFANMMKDGLTGVSQITARDKTSTPIDSGVNRTGDVITNINGGDAMYIIDLNTGYLYSF